MPSSGRSRPVVDWEAGERRRRQLEAELARLVRELPRLGVSRALVFGSFARGGVRGASDLDLILITDSRDPFIPRCAAFYRALAPAVGIDLLVYTPEEFEAVRDRPFFRKALAESKVIYEA